MNNRTALVIGMICLAALTVPAGAFPAVTRLWSESSATLLDPSGLTINSYGQAINGLSFQQDAVLTYNGWQYAAYYHGKSGGSGIDGYVCVARRKLDGSGGLRIGTASENLFSLSWGSGDWQIVELSDYTFDSNDAHNVVTLGICPNDGTIHLSFDHHGHPLHYRVSQAGAATHPAAVTWDASLFGPVRDYLTEGQSISGVTYPRFWQTPSGDLQFGYRTGGSGSGDWYMADYSGNTGLWSGRRQIINRYGTYSDSVFTNSGDRNAYMNPPGYSPDGRLHITWTWRESAGDGNHDICYAYSDDNGVTWYNTFGTPIADTSQGQRISLDSPGITIVPLDTNRGIINQQAQAVDAQGRVHILMFYCNGPRSGGTFGTIGQRRYYHHWRDTDGTWHQNQLAFDETTVSSWVGSRPKLFIRANGDAYAIYQAWQDGDLDSGDLYIRDGDLVIQAATQAAGWSDWQIVHVETGPFVGEALGDPYRFEDGVLSVMMQDSPASLYAWTPVRILDFQLTP